MVRRPSGASALSTSEVGRVRLAMRLRGAALWIAALGLGLILLDYWLDPVGEVPRARTNPLTFAALALAFYASARYRPLRAPSPAKVGFWLLVIALALCFPWSAQIAARIWPGHDLGQTGANTAGTLVLIALARLLSRRMPRAAFVCGVCGLLVSLLAVIGNLLPNRALAWDMSVTTQAVLVPLALATILGFFRHPLLRPILSQRAEGKLMRGHLALWALLALGVPMLSFEGLNESRYFSALHVAEMAVVLGAILYFNSRYATLLSESMRAQGLLIGHSLRDALTGAANRAAAQNRFASYPPGQPVGIIMIDLDHFKAINDTYGHTRGDEVLQEAAEAMRGAVRASDLLVRWGGDEFLAILPVNDRRELADCARRLRAAVRQVLVDADRVLPLRASFGVTLAEPGTSPQLDHWVAEVDQALYRAKHAGRDRVMLADSLRLGRPGAPSPGSWPLAESG